MTFTRNRQMTGYTLNLSAQEYEQILVDIEGCSEELTSLSRDVDWFSSEMPERCELILEIIKKAKRNDA